MPLRPGWRHSIGTRFTVIALVLILGINLCFFAVAGFVSYRVEVAHLNQTLEQVRKSHIPSLISSLWVTNHSLLREQVRAIARFRYIHRVEVEDDEGQVFSAGQDDRGELEVHRERLVYTRRGKGIEVGALRLFVDQMELRRQAVGNLWIPFAGTFLAALAVAVAMALLFRRQIGRHLEQLVRDLQQDPSADLGTPFTLARRRRPDELSCLVDAINRMRSTLRDYLEERELLLAEVHHRIKNDMQFVQSLLLLQAGEAESAELREELEGAARRVSVMGRIYERLYRDEDFQEIEVRSLAERILDDLQQRGVLSGVAINLEAETLHVPVKVSVTVGIILNELVTNALKYAAGTQEGPLRIHVRLCEAQEGRALTLTVADNGPGLPGDVLSGETKGYGLTILSALAGQYGGTLQLWNDGGAAAAVTLEL